MVKQMLHRSSNILAVREEVQLQARCCFMGFSKFNRAVNDRTKKVVG